MLDDTPITATVEVAADGATDFLPLPARPGVLVFEDHDGRATLIATTADLRGLARTRLGEVGADALRGGVRTDHRAITRRVHAIEAGSALEADIIYLAQARQRMPEMHRVVSERWRAWFVHVDPDAEFPQWTKSCLTGQVRARSAGSGVNERSAGGLTIGPLPDKDSAGRFIERVIDAFDLCREHHLLVQAPRARACPYKEMGRCPAPCDGTEPMESYRSRVRRAASLIVGGMADMRSRLEADMASAAAAHDFEIAAELKQQFVRIDGLMAPAFAHVCDLARWSLVVVVPGWGGAKAGLARALLMAGGRMSVIGESAADALAGVAEWESLAARALVSAREAPAIEPDQAQLDTISAVTRWLYSPAARKRGVAVRVAEGVTAAGLGAELAAAARAVSRPKRAAAVVDQVMEPRRNVGGEG